VQVLRRELLDEAVQGWVADGLAVLEGGGEVDFAGEVCGAGGVGDEEVRVWLGGGRRCGRSRSLAVSLVVGCRRRPAVGQSDAGFERVVREIKGVGKACGTA
jgi:hypothetical protein